VDGSKFTALSPERVSEESSREAGDVEETVLLYRVDGLP